MSRSLKRGSAVLAGALVTASVAYAIGTQTGGGAAVAGTSTSSSSSSAAPAFEGRFAHDRGGPGGPGGGPGRGLSALADTLGVTEAKLRAALEDLRDEQPRPDRDHADLTAKLAGALGISQAKVASALRAARPERGERHGDHHAALAAALAKELGLSADKVEAAIEKVHPEPGDRRRENRSDHEAALAEELGVSVAKLRAALAEARPARGPFGGDLAALAKAMGVEESALRSAFEKIHADMEAEHETRRAAFAKALAGKLGLDAEKVEDALGDGPFFHGGHRGGPRGPR